MVVGMLPYARSGYPTTGGVPVALRLETNRKTPKALKKPLKSLGILRSPRW